MEENKLNIDQALIKSGQKENKLPVKDSQGIVELSINYKEKEATTHYGIVPNNSITSAAKEFIIHALEFLISELGDDNEFQGALNDLMEGKEVQLSYVREPCVTCFMGDPDDKDSNASSLVKTFRSGQRVEVEVTGLLFIPNQMIVGICQVNQGAFQIEGEYPHIVLMKGEGCSAKLINNQLKSLFGHGGPAVSDYTILSGDIGGPYISKVDYAESEGVTHTYLVRKDSGLKFVGETRDFNATILAERKGTLQTTAGGRTVKDTLNGKVNEVKSADGWRDVEPICQGILLKHSEGWRIAKDTYITKESEFKSTEGWRSLIPVCQSEDKASKDAKGWRNDCSKKECGVNSGLSWRKQI